MGAQTIYTESKNVTALHPHIYITFTFSHLADAFIQSDLHMCDLQGCIHILHLH